MKNDRITELQDISNDFLRSLGEEDINEIIKNHLQTDTNENIKNNSDTRTINIPNFSLTRLYKKEQDKKESLVKHKFIINKIIFKFLVK